MEPCPVCNEPRPFVGYINQWSVSPGEDGYFRIPHYRCEDCNLTFSVEGEPNELYEWVATSVSLAKIEGGIEAAS